MKCAIYIRTSTTEQTPEKQLAECIEVATNKGYEYEVFEEQLSGYKDIKRPKYEEVKERARKGEIKAVVVWALDRWIRNRDTLLEDVTILKNYGCRIHSVKEAWVETINIEGSLGRTLQDFLIGLIGSLAEMESERKSERVKMAYKSHKGKWGRPAMHTNKKKIVWDLLSKGLSLRVIAKEVNLSVGAVHKIKQENPSQIPP